MFVTKLVSKLDISKSYRDMQSENIYCIFSTFLVEKFDISICLIDIHPKNIYDISLTLLILIFEKLTNSNELQFSKI